MRLHSIGWLALFIVGVSCNVTPRAILTPNSASVSFPAAKGNGHSFNVKFSNSGKPSYCISSGKDVCLSWENGSRVTATKVNGESARIKISGTLPFSVCFPLKGAHLYGGPIATVYPQEGNEFKDRPYITADNIRYKMVQAVAERYWYTSAGLNIKVNPEAPIFVSQSKEELCFSIENKFPYATDDPLEFSYDTCLPATNLREGVGCFFKKYDKPIPPNKVIESPIWSTWVEYKTDISQEKAIEFFNKIKNSKIGLGVMEIDDEWETCYGSQIFNKKFPDPKKMVDLFHSEGYLTTLWVHPFVGPGCPSLQPYEKYLIKLPNGSIGLTEWWNGKPAALVNFNDPKTVDWFVNRLKKIQQDYGFDSFKFDAGEVTYIPGMSLEEQIGNRHYPNEYTRNYVKMASEFGTLAEVRVGAEAHEYKIMQRLQDTNSVWDATNWGLRSVIKSTLQLSLHGYGAIMPDMVGGNVYNDQAPSKELYIRWVQLNAFLPIIQFSLAPWKFDDETLAIARKFTDLHYEYSGRILDEFKNDSHPVINPVWWISPEDTTAQTIDDEFLLGVSLLVAPVVREGEVSRDIYLPAGTWKDANTQEVHQGPKWIRKYNAPLEVLPYFFAV